MRTRKRSAWLMASLFASATAAARADSWPQFRGPNGASTAADAAKLPTEISPEQNVVWKVPIPPGHSSPVLAGGRIFVTADKDKRLFTIALDAKTGRTLWTTEAAHKGLEIIHQIGSHAQSSPASDGKFVVVFFGSTGLFCLDAADGREVWHQPLGPFKNEFGAASSPIIVGETVVLNQDHDVDSFLTAIDLKSGRTLWKTARPDFPRSFATPVVWNVGGRKQIVVAGCIRVVGYDFETGAEVWTARGLSRTIATTPMVGADGDLYLSAWTPATDAGERVEIPDTDEYFSRYDANKDGVLTKDEIPDGPIKQRFGQFDRDKDGRVTKAEFEFQRGLFAAAKTGLMRIRPGGKGDITADHVVWRQDKLLPYVPSPLVVGDTVFTVKNGGVTCSRSAADGALIKSARVRGSGDYYASPVVGDGKIYLVSRNGELTVISAEPQWKELSAAEFKEDVFATPAIADGRIYLRTAGHLYCFAAK